MNEPAEIWAHRVNSIEKLQALEEIYNGIELDIVYMGDDFDITHPPTKSIGLSLDTYLTASKRKSTLKFWLDFKNLSDENAIDSASRLVEICLIQNLNHKQFIIESQNIEALETFKKLGFQASYFIPPGLFTLREDTAQKRINDIRKRMNKRPTFHMSSNYKDYTRLRTAFPKQSLLLWHTGGLGRLTSDDKKALLARILSDNLVHILLIDVKTNFDR